MGTTTFLFNLLLVAAPVLADGKFPTMPDEQVTPGALCVTPSEYRYPEKIPYCSRAVGGDTKHKVIDLYDKQFGYTINDMNRGDFKIDHLIPLCAGGSNEETNLWPQHKSVYAITDPLEPLLCQLMSEGSLKQAEAVEIVLDVKHHLEKAADVIASLKTRLKKH